VWTSEGLVGSDQCADEASEGVVFCLEDARDVFPHGVSKRLSCKAMHKVHICEREATPRVVERAALTGG
jgi:hypothetical protein